MPNVLLRDLEIEYYRGFFEKQTLKFAVPNDKPGSGLTLITGANNSGKTTIIDSLLFTCHYNTQPRFTEHDRHKNKISNIRLRWRNKSGNECDLSFNHSVNTSLASFYSQDSEPKRPDRELLFILAKREWSTVDNSINTEGNVLGLGSGGVYNMGQIINRYRTLKHYGSTGMLDQLSGLTEERKINLNNYMRRLIPNFENWSIDTDESGDYVKYQTTDGSSHKARLLGNGVLSLLFICTRLLDMENSSGNVLIIDEPELSLHPETQKQLAAMFSEISSRHQVIICTHSPYFVNWRDFINEAKFIRLNKMKSNDSEAQRCVIFELKNEANYKNFIANNLTEYQKPQLLDTVAKEIMFTDKILFVEGQEDVGILRKWLDENSVNLSFSIFGYGVGSHSNMKLFLELSKDLGLQKVGALYDGDKAAEISYEADKKEFEEQGYAFFKLPTEDIRDKEYNKCSKKCKPCERCRKKKEKEGCFDIRGQLKPKLREDFEQIWRAVTEYFS